MGAHACAVKKNTQHCTLRASLRKFTRRWSGTWYTSLLEPLHIRKSWTWRSKCWWASNLGYVNVVCLAEAFFGGTKYNMAPQCAHTAGVHSHRVDVFATLLATAGHLRGCAVGSFVHLLCRAHAAGRRHASVPCPGRWRGCPGAGPAQHAHARMGTCVQVWRPSRGRPWCFT